MLGKKSLAAAIGAAGVLAFGAAPVYADSSADAVTCVSVTGGKACFHSSGDKLVVTDTKSDGNYVVAIWDTDYGRDGLCDIHAGKGKSRTCNYNMKEGHLIVFNVVVANGDGVVHESRRREATI